MAFLAVALAPFQARAAGVGDMPIDVRADDVTLDARLRELEVSGHVRVDSPPFHLRSERLHLERSSRGVVVRGEGKLAFCPCLGTPLAVAFDGALVAPPGDLFLDQPRLEVFGLPVLWLPFFWLRSPSRVGLLSPELAYRGRDGLFVGEGVHVPWTQGDARNGLDVRAGAYLKGGVAVDAQLRTEVSATRVRWDHLHDGRSGAAPGRDLDDGLAVDARGSAGGVAWDADVIRGARGVIATSDLDAAARVYDRAAAEGAWRSGGWTVASGVRATNVRGARAFELGAAGPVVSVRRAEAIGEVGAYDAHVEGGTIGGAGLRAASFARGAAGAFVASHVGAVGASLAVRGAGDAGDDGARAAADGAASARAELALPLVRAYESSEPNDPWRHRVEPRVALGVLATRGDELFGFLPGTAGVRGAVAVADLGLATALGRWAARDGLEVSASAGGVGDAQDALPAARWRAAAHSAWMALGAEGAHLFSFRAHHLGGGAAFAARARVGRIDWLHVAADVAARQGVDPIAARALTDAPLEPSSGFLSAAGWTGGARVAVPFSSYVTTRAGVDADLSAEKLVAAHGSLEIRDKCGCVVIRANGAHRLGRDGVDVWLTVDLAP